VKKINYISELRREKRYIVLMIVSNSLTLILGIIYLLDIVIVVPRLKEERRLGPVTK